MVLAKAFLAMLLFSVLIQTSTQSIEGVVVDRVTSAALTGVDVELTGIAEDRVVSYTGKTDGQGKFAFRNVAASSGYWLIATHGDEHVQTLFGQRGLTGMGDQLPVASGQQLRDIRISMIPTGEISGRVLTNEGKPLRDAQVVAMTVLFRDGVRTLRGVASYVETNAKGEYRIAGLAPGPYTLRVSPHNAPSPTGVFPRDARGDRIRIPGIPSSPLFEEEGYPAVYFPGVREASLAQTVDLRAGAHLAEVNVSTEKVHTHRIRGMVFDSLTGQLIAPAQILVIRRGAEAGSIPSIILSSSNGRFDERGLVPGTYYAVATAGDPNNPMRGRTAFEMADSDIENLRIPVGRGYDLSGTIALDRTSSAAVSGVRVTLRPNSPSRPGIGPPSTLLEPSIEGAVSFLEVGTTPVVRIPPSRASLNGDTLTFRGVNVWEYSVVLENLPENTYVESMRIGDRDVLANGLRVDGPIQDSLKIVIGTAAGTIDGRVVDLNGSYQLLETAIVFWIAQS